MPAAHSHVQPRATWHMLHGCCPCRLRWECRSTASMPQSCSQPHLQLLAGSMLKLQAGASRQGTTDPGQCCTRSGRQLDAGRHLMQTCPPVGDGALGGPVQPHAHTRPPEDNVPMRTQYLHSWQALSTSVHSNRQETAFTSKARQPRASGSCAVIPGQHELAGGRPPGSAAFLPRALLPRHAQPASLAAHILCRKACAAPHAQVAAPRDPAAPTFPQDGSRSTSRGHCTSSSLYCVSRAKATASAMFMKATWKESPSVLISYPLYFAIPSRMVCKRAAHICGWATGHSTDHGLQGGSPCVCFRARK